METVIKTENLCKYYKSIKAVDDLSLSVNKGEIYGFLGINGAGKTTTIRLLLGLVNPTGGNIYINGRLISNIKKQYWNKVGYLIEDTYSYPELTVIENLDIVFNLRGLVDKDMITNIINKLSLNSYKDTKFKDLSSGNKQRLGLAKALIHNPEILILDEPTKGLDPAGIVELRSLLNSLSTHYETTIFISSHILSEVSKLVDRIGIIHEGKLIQEVDNNELAKLKKRYLLIDTINNKKAKSILSNMDLVVLEIENGKLKITNKYALAYPELLVIELVKKGVPPKLIKVEQEDLESYFLRLTGKNKSGRDF